MGPTDGIDFFFLSGTRLDWSRTGTTQGCCFVKTTGKDRLVFSRHAHKNDRTSRKWASLLLCTLLLSLCRNSDCLKDTKTIGQKGVRFSIPQTLRRQAGCCSTALCIIQLSSQDRVYIQAMLA